MERPLERPTVYYVGAFRFPDGDAAAARVLGTGKALRDEGARVVFGGWEKYGRQEDRQVDGTYQFDGFPYVSHADIRHCSLAPIRRFVKRITAGQNTLTWLKKQAVRPGDVVVAYHGGTYFISALRRWCSANRLRLVIDCTEWYSPLQIPGGLANPAWWDSEIARRLSYISVGRIMVISSYLEQYYSSRGCAVLRVPPLTDLQDSKWARTHQATFHEAPLKLAYAGAPGRKDLLGNVLKGLLALRSQDVSVVLNIYGPTREALLAAIPEAVRWLPQLGDDVIFHGRVSQRDVPRRLMESHFTVLLRPDKRYTKAGFPTKIVESLSAGVPVITNRTSDVGQYIRDGEEGLLLADPSPTTFASAVRRAAALGPRGWDRLSTCARKRAECTFDYRKYTDALRRFILESAHDGAATA